MEVGTTLARDLPFLQELCHALPKVELHRHLTGSMPVEAVQAILEETAPHIAADALLVTPRSGGDDPEAQQQAWDILIKQCNAVKVAAQPKGNLERLFRAAIEQLAHDNVAYCEYRIGIKPEPTKRAYLDTLLSVIEEQRKRFPTTTVRLLLSVARHGDLEYAQENVDIAIEYFQRAQQQQQQERTHGKEEGEEQEGQQGGKQYTPEATPQAYSQVQEQGQQQKEEEQSRDCAGSCGCNTNSTERPGEVSGRADARGSQDERREQWHHQHHDHTVDPIVCGVELGGVATAKAWDDFKPLFEQARHAGLRVALHCGENRQNQEEPRAMIEFAPDRLGHCVYLSKDNIALLRRSQVPVETCLTCHDLCFGVPIPNNIFASIRDTRQVCLATDNPSFYQASLTDEYVLCCKHHDLTVADLFALARRAIDFAFLSDQGKQRLRERFDATVAELKRKYNLHG